MGSGATMGFGLRDPSSFHAKLHTQRLSGSSGSETKASGRQKYEHPFPPRIMNTLSLAASHLWALRSNHSRNGSQAGTLGADGATGSLGTLPNVSRHLMPQMASHLAKDIRAGGNSSAVKEEEEEVTRVVKPVKRACELPAATLRPPPVKEEKKKKNKKKKAEKDGDDGEGGKRFYLKKVLEDNDMIEAILNFGEVSLTSS
eukprot:47632-Eustigmatos_ZCMA.PRE.1